MAVWLIILFFFLVFAIVLSSALIVLQLYTSLINQKQYDNIFETEERFLKLYDKKTFDEYFYRTETVILRDGHEVVLHIYSNYKKLENLNFVVFHHGIKCTHESGNKYCLLYMELPKFAFVSYDSRGWGASYKNKPVTFGYHEKEDLYDVIEHLKSKYEPKTLGIHGESMGGGTVMQYLAKYKDEHNLSFAVADSPFINFKNVLKFHSKMNYPKVPFGYIFIFLKIIWRLHQKFSLKEIDATDKLVNINTPLLVIFSRSDAMIPFSEYENLKITSLRFESFLTDHAPHVLSVAIYREEFREALLNFIQSSEDIRQFNIKNNQILRIKKDKEDDLVLDKAKKAII